MESKRYTTLQCFNPFSKSGHRIRIKNKLRTVTEWMRKNFNDLPKEAKVCD